MTWHNLDSPAVMQNPDSSGRRSVLPVELFFDDVE